MNPTLQRLGRLLVMVPWLLEHPGAGVDEVAERFHTTPEAVLDDLDVLGYCGLPGYGGGDLIETSVSGGRIVVRMADYFARPLALSVREGIALLLAARATRDSGVLDGGATPLQSAIDKLERHLGTQAHLPVAGDFDAGGSDMLGRLMPAVSEHRVVRLTYRSASKEEITTRDVEPWGLRSEGGSWYLQGRCRLAEAPRAFRLDRIIDAVVTDETAPAPPDDAPRAMAYQPADDDPVVVLDLDPAAAWVTDQIVLDDRQTLPDGRLRLTFRASTLSWATSLVLRLGGAATVVAPDALAALVRDRAARALARYELTSSRET